MPWRSGTSHGFSIDASSRPQLGNQAGAPSGDSATMENDMTQVLIADIGDRYTQASNLNINDDVMWDLLKCASLIGRFPNATIAIKSDSPPTDYFEVGSMIVVSQRLKQTLDSFRAKVEFFKLNIQTDSGDCVADEYYCCNILDCVDCIDYNRSKLAFNSKPGFNDRIDEIQQLVIDETVADSHMMFRIANGAEYIVAVNDRLADSLTQGGFSGCKCISPEEWYFGCVYL
jgi:hypothetical protein